MRNLQLRHLARNSAVHRLRSDAKIVTLMLVALGVAFNPSWPVVGVGWAFLVAAFLLARLPRSIVAPPPRMYFWVVGFGGMFSLFSGGSPVVGGVALGGILEFALLVAVGLLLVAFAALLAWTTPQTEVGLGLVRLLRPLRILRLPVDELSTTVMLATRCLPMIGDELRVAMDAQRTRPPEPDRKQGVLASLGQAVDFGATVVVGSHRRSRELARAMVARGSITAPAPTGHALRAADAISVAIGLAACTAAFVWG